MTSTTFRPDNSPYEPVAFDVRAPGVIECVLSERAGWGKDAAVELLGSGHVALIVRVGGAARIRESRAT